MFPPRLPRLSACPLSPQLPTPLQGWPRCRHHSWLWLFLIEVKSQSVQAGSEWPCPGPWPSQLLLLLEEIYPDLLQDLPLNPLPPSLTSESSQKPLWKSCTGHGLLMNVLPQAVTPKVSQLPTTRPPKPSLCGLIGSCLCPNRLVFWKVP